MIYYRVKGDSIILKFKDNRNFVNFLIERHLNLNGLKFDLNKDYTTAINKELKDFEYWGESWEHKEPPKSNIKIINNVFKYEY